MTKQEITKEFTMHTRFRLPALAALLSGAFSAWAADAPVKGGTLIYLSSSRIPIFIPGRRLLS